MRDSQPPYTQEDRHALHDPSQDHEPWLDYEHSHVVWNLSQYDVICQWCRDTFGPAGDRWDRWFAAVYFHDHMDFEFFMLRWAGT